LCCCFQFDPQFFWVIFLFNLTVWTKILCPLSF
jgi:hypothetical protein